MMMNFLAPPVITVTYLGGAPSVSFCVSRCELYAPREIGWIAASSFFAVIAAAERSC